MRDDHAEVRLRGEPDRIQRLAHGPDLIELDEDRVPDPALDAARQTIDVGHEEVVPDELDAVPDPGREGRPTLPVVFVEPVFDRDDGIRVKPVLVERHEGLRVEFSGLTGALEPVHAGFRIVEFRRGAIERERDLRSGLVTGIDDRGHNEVQSLAVRRQVRGHPALVPDGGRIPRSRQSAPQGVKHLHADPKTFGETRRAERQNHELLDVDRVVGVRAPVEDIQHWDREDARIAGAQVSEQGRPRRGRGRARRRHGDRKDRVRPEATLVRRAVERDERGVEPALVRGVAASRRGRDLPVDVRDRT